MTDRERWIVYPLLFLALGVGIRDKLMRTVRTDRLECKAIFFTDKSGSPIVGLAPGGFDSGETSDGPVSLIVFDQHLRRRGEIGSHLRSESLLVTDEHDRPLVTAGKERAKQGKQTIESGSVRVFNNRGQPQVILAADAQGGLVRVVDRRQSFSLDLGHFDLAGQPLSGLIAADGKGRVQIFNRLIPRKLSSPVPGPPEPPADAD